MNSSCNLNRILIVQQLLCSLVQSAILLQVALRIHELVRLKEALTIKDCFAKRIRIFGAVVETVECCFPCPISGL